MFRDSGNLSPNFVIARVWSRMRSSLPRFFHVLCIIGLFLAILTSRNRYSALFFPLLCCQDQAGGVVDALWRGVGPRASVAWADD